MNLATCPGEKLSRGEENKARREEEQKNRGEERRGEEKLWRWIGCESGGRKERTKTGEKSGEENGRMARKGEAVRGRQEMRGEENRKEEEEDKRNRRRNERPQK